MMRSVTKKSALWMGGLLSICILAGSVCDVKQPLIGQSDSPYLKSFIAPSTLYLGSAIIYPVRVDVSDPQGWSDIQIVRLSIRRTSTDETVWEDTLRDDGLAGDILPRDGQFFTAFPADVTGGVTGSYDIRIVAEDRAGHSSTELQRSMDAIDSEKNLAPEISNPEVPDTLSEESLASVEITIHAQDAQGLNDIDSVFLQVYPPFQPVWFSSLLLWDSGPPGDLLADDGIFSLNADLRDVFTGSGDYGLRFQAADSGGLLSDPIVRTVYVARANGPPVLSQLSAPDTISRASGQPILLSVRVDDPQGSADVRSVFFNTIKPNGIPSAGNPFSMFDDGSSGDITAQDGVYSITIVITPQNMTGEYRFDFFAEDYSGAQSPALSHFITVVD